MRSCDEPRGARTLGLMGIFRVVETLEVGWVCQRGLHVYDQHDDLESALGHMRELMLEHPAGELFLHWLNGTVSRAGSVLGTGEDA